MTKEKLAKAMTEQLLLCKIEQRRIDRVINDSTIEELLEIYHNQFIPLKSSWEELSPQTWEILLSISKGTDEKRILNEQRLALRIAWKTQLSKIIATAKTTKLKEQQTN